MNFRLVIGISLIVAYLAQFLSLPTLSASEAFLTKSGHAAASAVDANGVRHGGLDYRGKLPPWLRDDVIKAVAPAYPDRDRILRHEGNGLFQLTLDLKTGLATRVAMIKSTGFPALDTSAVASLRQWRWKAGKWKEIQISVRFNSRLEDRPPPRSARLQPAGRQ
jgi:TonB family protein